uniref:Uncharacterized protein n=1 Tax=Parascaris equorum TaxID=6256 RepID=A0A914RF57_PAREQ
MISGVSEVDDTMEKNLHDMSRRFGGSPFFLFGGECAPLSQLFGAQGADMEANEVTIVFSDPCFGDFAIKLPRDLFNEEPMDFIVGLFRLVDEGVRLNLSLIRWRLVPEIDLQRFSNLRCLILGSGTLGCNIPMPGHTVAVQGTKKTEFGTVIETLSLSIYYLHLIAASIAVVKFAVTLSVNNDNNKRRQREGHGRKAREFDKRQFTIFKSQLAISVAMGFDSYVVIRHGVTCFDGESEANSAQTSDKLLIAGSELGCYFCSDSQYLECLCLEGKVSRAGVSMAAAGMSVELLASVLQHPKQGLAPARIGEVDDTASVLGAAPHQIRAFISRFHQVCNPVQRSWLEKVLAFSFLPTLQEHLSAAL